MLGPGDDGALIQSLPGGLVISTDSYFEGSRYQSAWLDPEQLGERCLGATLSDLAAMEAASILYALADAERTRDRRLYRASRRRARADGSALQGGPDRRRPNPRLAQGLVITVLGTPLQERVLLATARAGDELWVSGQLGASAAGLDVLKVAAIAAR